MNRKRSDRVLTALTVRASRRFDPGRLPTEAPAQRSDEMRSPSLSRGMAQMVGPPAVGVPQSGERGRERQRRTEPQPRRCIGPERHSCRRAVQGVGAAPEPPRSPEYSPELATALLIGAGQQFPARNCSAHGGPMQ